MGREKERHMMQDEPSGEVCMCSNPIPYDELENYYENGVCNRCNYLMNNDD